MRVADCLRVCAWVAAAVFLIRPAAADPSYSCAKAASAAEQEVCRVPNLQWFDRQLARMYGLAREQDVAHRDALQSEQRAFLAARDACGTNDDCIEARYKARLVDLGRHVNVYEPFATYVAKEKEISGVLDIARFGVTDAFKILTVGGGGHTCVFETDNAVQTGKGVVHYRDPKDSESGGECVVFLNPDGDGRLRVETQGCHFYCGMRAIMDGLYTRVP